MSSRTTAQVAGAAAVSVANNSDGVTPANKKTKLADLPAVTLEMIAKFASRNSFTVLIDLASADDGVSRILEEWKCCKCEGAIFLVEDDGNDNNNNSSKLSIADYADPYFCGVCGAKFCGKFCGSADPGNYACHLHATCVGCREEECHGCMLKHWRDCVACHHLGLYCSECQGPCDTYCDVCGFSYCKHHGDHCDMCVTKTCGVHVSGGCDKCTYCETRLCPNCHNHGDKMWSCFGCGKKSCNADGDGNTNCPVFVIGHQMNWPHPPYAGCDECVEAERAAQGDY